MFKFVGGYENLDKLLRYHINPNDNDECVDVCSFWGKLGHVSLNAHTYLKEDCPIPLALTNVERVTLFLLQTCLTTWRILQSWYLESVFSRSTHGMKIYVVIKLILQRILCLYYVYSTFLGIK